MRFRLSSIISLTILILAVAIKFGNFVVVNQLQLATFDVFQQNHPRPYSPQPVRIVDIDDESLALVGQWPWPRTKLATLTQNLTEMGAAAIAFDVVFAEKDRTSPKQIAELWDDHASLKPLIHQLPDHDALFAESIAQSNVVTGFVLTSQLSRRLPDIKAGYSHAGADPKPFVMPFTGSVNSIRPLEEAAAGNGALNSSPDRDGILRRVPLIFRISDRLIPSLAAESLRIAQGAGSYIVKSSDASGSTNFNENTGITHIKIGGFSVPTDATGTFWMHYTEEVPERYVPAWKVVDATSGLDPALIEGHIVLIGTSAAGLKDIRSTPLNPVTSGVEVHAQALEQILSDSFLHRPDWVEGAEMLGMILIGLALIFLLARLGALWGAVFTAITLTSAIGLCWYLFVHHQLLIDPVTPSLAILMVYFSESLIRYISTEREKRQVRDAFSHYMSPDLVNELAANPDSLKLGGEMKEMTVLFLDIRGFTTISEGFDAQGLTHFINQFLTPMTDVILSHRGTIDKYMGDCIMAFWNAPLDDPDHARHACIASLKMYQALNTLNQQRKEESETENVAFLPIHIGVGLNTGECCVGNMGSDQRFDYSVLGDAVNLASRLEGQSKTYGVDVVIGNATHHAVADMATLELDLIRVKGKTQPEHIFALLGDDSLAARESFQQFRDQFHAMLKAYRSQAWDDARQLLHHCRSFEEVNLQTLFDLYEARMEDYRHQPPGEAWDGVFVATSK
jgi:adenylate cyclase